MNKIMKIMLSLIGLICMGVFAIGATPLHTFISDDDSYFKGNVGLGTDSPKYDLDIDGSLIINSTDDRLFRLDNSIGETWSIRMGSNGLFIIRSENNAKNPIILYGDTGNAVFLADVSALTFTDRTKRSKLTNDELKSKIKMIDSSKDICGLDGCEIDKNSYPVEWVNEYQSCKIMGINDTCLEYETKKGRDLTKVVSDLVRLARVQQITIDDLYNRIVILENKLNK